MAKLFKLIPYAAILFIPTLVMGQVVAEFYNVYVVNTTDLDSDSYYEFWSFEVDMDASDGSSEVTTSIILYDDLGNNLGTFGPFTFTGTLTSDNAIIGPLSGDIVPHAGTGALILFKFKQTADPNDSTNQIVSVDVPPSGLTYIASIDTVSINDYDSDGWLEQWSFDIDVDVTGGASDTTSITLTDDEGNDWGTYGPYTLNSTSSADNVIIGPITGVEVAPTISPSDVIFTFTLSESGLSDTYTVPVEDTTNVANTFIWSVTVVEVR